MSGYQTLVEAANRIASALELTDDVDVWSLQQAVAVMEGQVLPRRQFEKQALRFDRAFHGLALSGYAPL
jgi:hypothetical protein